MTGTPDKTAPRHWRFTANLAVFATVLMGLLYAWSEWQAIKHLTDIALIVLVVLNTVIVQQFGLRVAPNLGEMYFYFPDTSNDPQAAVDATLWHSLSVPFALTYAALIGGGVWMLDPWGDTADLRLWLAAFVFTGNLLIGMGLFAVFRFWQAAHKALPGLDIRILNLSRPPVVPLLRVNSQIVTVTAGVACLAILSVVLAGYDKDPLIILFSLFTLVLVIAAYAVPVVPLANRLKAVKLEELNRIESLIEAQMRDLTYQSRRPDHPPPEKDLPALDKLIEMRDIINKVRTLPPGGQISVSATTIVTFLSFLPAIIDYIANNIF